ncbi:hypothetical protein AK973_0540 [Pseudomonas brassicacearum]|nr:hypothetical protein AK973_0540 [Pseudomonas brassicacearum]
MDGLRHKVVRIIRKGTLTTDTKPEGDDFPCGSELARDCGGPATLMLNDSPLSRASSLPQVDRW